MSLAQVDDVVAATFVVAWRKFDLVEQVEQASLPWLFRIASFEVKSSFRTARRYGHALGSEVLEGIPNTVDEIFDTEPLRHAMAELSDVDQEILRLVHWDELTRSEIAEVLELAVSAVNMRYHRAIARLEQRLIPTTTPTRRTQMNKEHVAGRIEAMNPVTSTSPHKVEQAWAAFSARELAPSRSAGARRITLLGRQWSRLGLASALALTASFVGVGIAAAAELLSPAPVTNLAVAHCYTLDEIGANGTDVAAAGAPGSNAQVNNALGTCQMLWRDGFLAAGAPRAIHVTRPITVHSVPSLVVCTMTNGTAGVFPGDNTTCRTLGLPNALLSSSRK